MAGRSPAPDWELPTLRKFPPTRRYLIGVSGGRDSVALLHLLLARGYRKLIVCHLEHGLRGRAGRADARFVERLARVNGIEMESGAVDVRALAAKEKISIETAGRRARHFFFAEIARRRRCRTIFLAHHADDLVETFLMNLFRGSGLGGLGGMREISTHRVGRTDLELVRPLLPIWRDQIDRYVKLHALHFREDKTNRDLTPARNRFRQRIIPYLEKTCGRAIRRNLWKTATILAEEENWIDTLVARAPAEHTALDVEALRELPVALQRRTLLKWMRAHEIFDVRFDVIERVRALLDPADGIAKTNLPGDRHARRRAKKIFIERLPPVRHTKPREE